MTLLKELSDLNPDGTRLGQSAADLVGFHGATPTVQGTAIASVPTAGSAVASSNATAINSIITLLRDKGLIASS